MIKKICIFLSLVFCTIGGNAQSGDFYVSTAIDLSLPLSKNFKLGVKPDLRFNRFNNYEEYRLNLDFQYQLLKWAEIGAGYRYGELVENSAKYNRYSLFSSIDLPDFGSFKNSGKITYSNENNFETDDATNYLRYKYKLEYNKKDAFFFPYISYEWFRSQELEAFDKRRFECGMGIDVGKRQLVTIFYQKQTWLLRDKHRSLWGIEYAYKFKKSKKKAKDESK